MTQCITSIQLNQKTKIFDNVKQFIIFKRNLKIQMTQNIYTQETKNSKRDHEPTAIRHKRGHVIPVKSVKAVKSIKSV